MSDIDGKRARFVEEYIVDLNATQAAIRAGYSEKTAYSQGQRLLKDVEIAAAIAEAQKQRSERTQITADRVLQELGRVGFSNLSDVTDWGVREVAFGFDGDGKKLPAEDIGEAAMVRYVDAPFVKPINRDDLPPEVRGAVSEVSLGKEGFKIKMHDKVGALTQIGRHLGMFKDKVAVVGGDETDNPIQITNRDRAKAMAALIAKSKTDGGRSR
jgi:phage terminase small subunit